MLEILEKMPDSTRNRYRTPPYTTIQLLTALFFQGQEAELPEHEVKSHHHTPSYTTMHLLTALFFQGQEAESPEHEVKSHHHTPSCTRIHRADCYIVSAAVATPWRATGCEIVPYGSPAPPSTAARRATTTAACGCRIRDLRSSKRP